MLVVLFIIVRYMEEMKISSGYSTLSRNNASPFTLSPARLLLRLFIISCNSFMLTLPLPMSRRVPTIALTMLRRNLSALISKRHSSFDISTHCALSTVQNEVFTSGCAFAKQSKSCRPKKHFCSFVHKIEIYGIGQPQVVLRQKRILSQCYIIIVCAFCCRKACVGIVVHFYDFVHGNVSRKNAVQLCKPSVVREFRRDVFCSAWAILRLYQNVRALTKRLLLRLSFLLRLRMFVFRAGW